MMKFLDLTGLNTFWQKVKEYIDSNIINKMGANSGIATLDPNGKLTASQAPDVTIDNASATKNGLMSSSDFSKLSGIAAQATADSSIGIDEIEDLFK